MDERASSTKFMTTCHTTWSHIPEEITLKKLNKIKQAGERSIP
jgi:hypothetical protein